MVFLIEIGQELSLRCSFEILSKKPLQGSNPGTLITNNIIQTEFCSDLTKLGRIFKNSNHIKARGPEFFKTVVPFQGSNPGTLAYLYIKTAKFKPNFAQI